MPRPTKSVPHPIARNACSHMSLPLCSYTVSLIVTRLQIRARYVTCITMSCCLPSCRAGRSLTVSWHAQKSDSNLSMQFVGAPCLRCQIFLTAFSQLCNVQVSSITGHRAHTNTSRLHPTCASHRWLILLWTPTCTCKVQWIIHSNTTREYISQQHNKRIHQDTRPPSMIN